MLPLALTVAAAAQDGAELRREVLAEARRQEEVERTFDIEASCTLPRGEGATAPPAGEVESRVWRTAERRQAPNVPGTIVPTNVTVS